MMLQQSSLRAAAARPSMAARKASVVVRAAGPAKAPVARPARAQEQEAAAAGDHTPAARSALLGTAALVAPFLLETGAAFAKDGEFGSFLEGRFAALVHPAVMGALFLYTGYAGWLGWQWRRTRTIGDDIKALKATAPAVAAAAEGAPPAPPSPAEQQIKALEAERKELVQGGYRDKHFNAGSILLAGGVIIAIEGCLNTYMRTGKLFPGPHLFAGAGIVALWAAAAALVPAMQKGNEGARSAHIALNAVNLALFAWQVPTGLEIVGKVFQFVPKWF